jgi:hypothetical protein
MSLNIRLILILSVSVFSFVGCASQSMEVSRPSSPSTKSVKKLALMPGGGVLADAVGIQMMSQGFIIIDMTSSTPVSARVDMTELELTKPQNLKSLADEFGVDGVIIVKTVGGYDGKPNSVVARVIDTRTGVLLAGVTWQNGKGGSQDSVGDVLMRSDLSVAAKKIATGIATALK